ncbi:MAG: hypothetical protein IPL59_15830, partial [Candidatus Competibacteraceae bacterium]|nr:hypothetical protein [Candidatus Competibacteraceae bacterium]
ALFTIRDEHLCLILARRQEPRLKGFSLYRVDLCIPKKMLIPRYTGG